MFYLTTHSTHFIYGYMASDIWLRTILIAREETRCCHMGYSFRLTARVLLYAPSHTQDNTYHGLCYPSRGALAGKKNRSTRWPIGPWTNALPRRDVSLLCCNSLLWMCTSNKSHSHRVLQTYFLQITLQEVAITKVFPFTEHSINLPLLK